MSITQDWNPIISEIPVDTPVLLLLDDKLCGSEVQVGMLREMATGTMMTVGTLMAWDAPTIKGWRFIDNDETMPIRLTPTPARCRR